MKKIPLKFLIIVFLLFDVLQCFSQNKNIETLQREIESQKSEINQLRNDINNTRNETRQKIDNYASASMVLFLFGAFCALWAQNTGRNAWYWFFGGVFFNVITVFILLIKNYEED